MHARTIGAAFAALGVVLLPALAGEESPHEQALKGMLKSLDKMTLTLADVKDGDSAEAARPELKKLAAGWTAARAKADKLPPPEPAEKERLAKQYKGKMDEAIKKLLGEAGRINAIPAAKDVLKELRVVLEPP